MNIREFPLAWRWTQPSHSVFSEEVLSSMHPLSPADSANIQKLVRSLESSPGNLNKELFELVSIDAAEAETDEIARWLRERVGDEISPVVVSWSNGLALETSWQIFNEHWDDFCYPSSDDVIVWPKTGKWVLQYFHHELFTFGLRTAV